jgi:hypothetical protein
MPFSDNAFGASDRNCPSPDIGHKQIPTSPIHERTRAINHRAFSGRRNITKTGQAVLLEMREAVADQRDDFRL